MLWLVKELWTWGKPMTCRHAAGHWVEQAIEEPIWDEASQQYRFLLVKQKLWRCAVCEAERKT